MQSRHWVFWWPWWLLITALNVCNLCYLHSMASEAFQTFWPWNVRSDFESRVVPQRNWSSELVDTGRWFKPRKGMFHFRAGTWPPFKSEHLCLLLVEETADHVRQRTSRSELLLLHSRFGRKWPGQPFDTRMQSVMNVMYFLQMTQNSVEIDTTHTMMQRNLSDLLTLTRLQGIPGRKYESFLRVLQYRWCCVWVCFTILPGLPISASGIQYQSFKMVNMHLRWWLVQRCGRWTFSWMTLGWISQHKWQSGEAKPWDAAEIAL